MKKAMYLLVCIVLFSVMSATATAAENATPPDFRNVRWGMSQAEVIAAEPDVLLKRTASGNLESKVTVAGYAADLIYLFTDNRLDSAIYMFDITHSNDNQYIEDFLAIQKLLSSKYGNHEPITAWRDDLYKDDTKYWGFAISRGDLALISRWFTPTTEIGLMINGDNYHISITLIYQPIDRPSTTVPDTSGL